MTPASNPAGPAALATGEIVDAAGLAALEPEWWALWQRSPGATPFQSPAWLMPWWRHFAPGDLFTITVRHRGRLVGLAPLYIEAGPALRRLLPLGISLSDYLDVLIEEGAEETAGAAITAHLEARAELWDGLDLEELRPGALALTLPVPQGCREAATKQSACPVLALPASVEGLDEVIPASRRRKLRMARHRAARHGDATPIRIDPARAPSFLAELFALHEARWQGRGEAGLLADARVRRFHEDALPGLLRAGLARLYGLILGGRLAGAYYGFLHGREAYAYLGGFDPAFAFESPGAILMAHAIEEATREGAREFHFLRGQEAYKYEWGAVDRWNRRRSFRRAPDG